MGRNVNPLLAQIEARHESDLQLQIAVTRQQCKDMMLVAAADAFGFGEARLVRLLEAFDAANLEHAKITLQDAKDDKELAVAKSKLDQRLRQILGDHFVPFEKRYGAK